MNLLRIFKFCRRFIFTFFVKSRCKSYLAPLRVNGFSLVSKGTILGRNVNFNGIRISGGGYTRIGDNFHSGKNCSIISQCHNYDTGLSIPYDSTYIYTKILIDDNVWLGNNVIIVGNVTIGEGAIIQAGSVVVSDIPKCAIAGGHPAKTFKYRDIDHYENLKHLGMFF